MLYFLEKAEKIAATLGADLIGLCSLQMP